MKKILLALAFTFMITAALAQDTRDTLIYHLPFTNNKLAYTGSGTARGRDKKTLDSVAKKWVFGYFKDNKLTNEKAAVTFKTGDTSTLILYQGLLNYKVKPGMINIAYVAAIDIKICTADNYYSYKIDRIFFRPKSGFLNASGYQNDPEYLIRAYKLKHADFWTEMNVTRGQIRDYLTKMNRAVLDCITSLNKAMAN